MRVFRSDQDIEDAAIDLRKRLGIETILNPEMTAVLNKIKDILPSFKLERFLDDQMPDNIDAQCDAPKKIIKIKETIYQKSKEGDPRSRFTIAEEIGHLWLSHGGIRNRSVEKSAYERANPEIQREESEAKRFAGAFLAPQNLWKPEWDALAIQEKFQMSSQASEIRYRALSKCYRAKSGLHRDLPESVVDFLKEAAKRGIKIQTDI